jgi:hypothetical protein
MITLLLAQALTVGAPQAKAAKAGEPIPGEVSIEIRKVRRVGQKLTVSYAVTNKGAEPTPVDMTRPSVVAPNGTSLPVSQPTDEPPAEEKSGVEAKPEAAVIPPGVTVGRVVTFEIAGTKLDEVVYKTEPPVFNESMWYFVIGGQRVPFKF